MKKLIAILMLCVSVQAGALELDGAKLEDTVQVGGTPLVLNGAGIRSAIFFDIYAAGLYLTEKKNTATAVIEDEGAKRIELYVMREGDVTHFLEAIRKGVGKNYNEQQAGAFSERLSALDHMFAGVEKVKKAETINFDWVPGDGTHVSLNGKELGKIEGADFYHALLAVWIGDKPAKDKLKMELLGAR